MYALAESADGPTTATDLSLAALSGSSPCLFRSSTTLSLAARRARGLFAFSWSAKVIFRHGFWSVESISSPSMIRFVSTRRACPHTVAIC